MTKKIHHGDLVARPGTIYDDVTEITGGLDASGADTRTAFPKLTTVGGGLYASGANTRTAFPKLRHSNDADALRRALARLGFTLDDGVLCAVVRRRGAVARVRRVGSRELSYLVTDGVHHAHGRTLAEARADLLVKQGPRDTTPYQGWTADTVVPQEQAIAAYRAVTGACGFGVSQFLAGRTLPAKISIARVLSETSGAYGHDTFAAFIAAHSEAAP